MTGARDHARRFRVWRGDAAAAAELVDYATPVTEGMVVLDAIHQIQAEQANDLAVRWNCKAGKCGSCSAEVNGKPKLMCMTRLNELPLDQPVTVEPMRAFPLVKDLVTDVSWNFRVKKRIKPFKPRPPDAPDGTWRMRPGRRRPRAGVPQVHRVLPLPGRLPRPARSPPARRVHRPALPGLRRGAGDAPARHRGPGRGPEGQAHGIGYCNITKCCTKVCPEHITITDNAIIPLKERVVDQFYDPLGKLLKMFSRTGRGSMTATFDLKPISKRRAAALQKAERYRVINDPSSAESICLDVLAVDPENQQALVTLLLAITDQFDAGAGEGARRRAQELLPAARDEYRAAYYAGSSPSGGRRRSCAVAVRRRARWPTIRFARRWSWYEKAEARRPRGQRRGDPALEHLRAHPGARRAHQAPGRGIRQPRLGVGAGATSFPSAAVPRRRPRAPIHPGRARWDTARR